MESTRGGSSCGGGVPTRPATAPAAISTAPAQFTANLSLMPSTEVPGYNSLRVQKAYRINGIESGRLDKQLQILERQKLHTVRIVNNDIRLTRVALDHIEACSGHSVNQQGFLGSSTEGSTNNLTFAGDESSDKPMFLYGERQVSRRVGRFRRIQSAMGKGRSTSSANDELPLSELKQRPKSSIPTFGEIKTRVKRQLELNPDWDPNDELPFEDVREEETFPKGKVKSAWESEDRLSSAKVDRAKSGKRSSVSWHISKSPPASVTGDDADVITMIERENIDEKMGDVSRNVGASKANLKKSGIITKRSTSANVLKPRNLPTIEADEKTEKVNETEETSVRGTRKSVKSAKARLEKVHNSTPKPRNPRDHPMVKLVGQTRAAISKAKKAQSSAVYIDPEKSQLGTIIERQLKAKTEKLEKRREMHKLDTVSTESKVSDYLLNNPIAERIEERDAMTSYNTVRELLVERKIPLVSKLDKLDDHSSP